MTKKLQGAKKKIGAVATGILFSNLANAEIIPNPLYGMPTPEETLSSLSLAIFSSFFIMVIAPVIGLIMYRKMGGKRRWPNVIVSVLAIIFTLCLLVLIITTYDIKL